MRFSITLAKNRTSPYNEDAYIEAYKKAVPEANKEDTYDISAVTTLSGYIGHAMMNQSDNRSHDNQYHRCINFISDDELRKYL